MELLKRIEHYAKTEAQRVALYIDDEQLNYATLHERVKDAASRLPEYDLPLNVALSFSRIQDFVVGYLAVLSKGGTPWVMDANWSAARKKTLYETYDIPYLWRRRDFIKDKSNLGSLSRVGCYMWALLQGRRVYLKPF